MFPLGFHSQEVFIRPDYSIFSSEYEHIFNFFLSPKGTIAASLTAPHAL